MIKTAAAPEFLYRGADRLLRLLGKWIGLARVRFKILRYSRLGAGHVFDIRVDDIPLKMTFLTHKIGKAIVDRIEGQREPGTTAVMRALVRRGSKVLEIGGCYGEFTILLAKCAGPEGAVVTIEGTPNNFKVLQKNIQLNNLTNVSAYNYFIANGTDHVDYAPTENHPYGAIARMNQKDDGHHTNILSVPAINVTSLLEKIGFSPDVIFMDIEGFEVDVFEDLSGGYLRNRRPIVMFEIHRAYYKEARDLSLIKRILDQNQYEYREIETNLLCFPR